LRAVGGRHARMTGLAPLGLEILITSDRPTVCFLKNEAIQAENCVRTGELRSLRLKFYLFSTANKTSRKNPIYHIFSST
jgi:hypothetical protein